MDLLKQCRALFFILSSSFLVVLMFSCDNKKKDVFEVIQSRIVKDFESKININEVVSKVPDYLEKYNHNTGEFIDVDYQAIDRTNWPPLIHIFRLYDLTYAYTIKGKNNPYFENPSIIEVIEKGINFWCEKQPYCDNWWYNEVGEPHKTGVMLLQLRQGKKQLNKEVEDKLINRLATKGGDPKEWTGANKTDIALHWMYRACLTKDKKLLNIALSEGYYPIQFIPYDEGMQPDYSFFQHGTQLYIGGYGDEFLKGVLMFADYTAGTEYALDEERLSIVRNFALDTYFKVIRGSYIHMNVIGRGMSRENETKKNSTFADKLAKIDPDNASAYEIIAKRIKGEVGPEEGVVPVNTTYFMGDYVAHIRPQYAAGVRTVSTRTMRNEYGNGENFLTYFLSDGAMHLTQEGDEYYNIFPVWDWSRLPGVTNPYLLAEEIPRTKINWQTLGTEVFVGGASDSLYSVNTYRLNDSFEGINTSAYKSWFFFDDEIVCLGSGITSKSDYLINTTIEQNRLKGEIITCTSDGVISKIVNPGESFHNNTLKWVLHNNRGYVFPNGGKVHLKNEKREGRWSDINDTQSQRKVSEDVFTLWLNHGYRPTDDKYAYIIVPNRRNEKEMQDYDRGNIQICENSDFIQAVYHKGLNVLELVFLQEATFTLGDFKIKADNPSTVIVKGIGTSDLTLHISDPSQSEKVLTFVVEAPSIPKHTHKVVVDLRNSGVFAGKTVVYKID